MIEYKPYTYLLGWSKQNKWYYGCEYSLKTKIANPQNLLTIYFTSSKYVQKFIKKWGFPDIIKIRKVFSEANDARLWEQKVLQKINVINDNRWPILRQQESPLGRASHQLGY